VYVFGAVVYALSSLLAWRAGLADRTFSGDAGAENNESDVGAADGASKTAVDADFDDYGDAVEYDDFERPDINFEINHHADVFHDVVEAPEAKDSRTLRRRDPKK
jgi:hypothetical protein